MDLIDKYLGESDWKEFYNMSKDKSGKTFKQYEKKYGGYKYQAPHVQDALKKAKNFKDFERMLKKFNEAKKDYLGEGAKKVLKFSGDTQYLDEIDALLVRGGVTGNPDFTNITITIDKKDLKKAEKILKGTSYRRYTVEAMSVPDKHQKKIAIDTVKNPMKGALLGGPSAEEAEKILRKKFGYSDAQIKKLKRG